MPNLALVHLNGLRAVEIVARCGSLPKAGEVLGVSASAVSQQVNRTEKQLGVRLFERTPTGLVPTAFGAAFAARLASGFRELSGAVAMAAGKADKVLVVSVAPAFAARWLVPRLSRFYAAHPDILLRIDASTRLIDLDDSDCALAIRLGDGAWAGLESELLFAQDIFPVCAPDMAERLTTIADLEKVCVITDQGTMINWQQWFAAAGSPPVASRPGATFTDPMLCLEAAIAGHGVMLAWQLLAADALADGRLAAPFGIKADSGLGYHVVSSQRSPPDRKAIAFRRWLAQEAHEQLPVGRAFPGRLESSAASN